MTFHRLNLPDYFIVDDEDLPDDYDRLNDPSTTGGSGVAAPSDTGPKSGGDNDGVYFIAERDPATAFNANRGLHALGENTDFLDDLFHRDVAVPTRLDVASGHGGSNSADLDGSSDNIYVSSSGTTPLSELFVVTDDNDEPIYVDGARVTVTDITGADVGDGFVDDNPLTLTLSDTIPNDVAFRVYYGIRGNLATLPENAFTFMDIPRPVGVRAANALGVDDSLWTALELGNIHIKAGGIGTGVAFAQDAFDNIDTRLTQLRAFTATISDSSNSAGGDINAAELDDVIVAASSDYDGGIFLMKHGSYTISDTPEAWDVPMRILGSASTNTNSPIISLSSGRSDPLLITSPICLEGVSLQTLSDTALFEVKSKFIMDGRRKICNLNAGCLKFNLGGGGNNNSFSLLNVNVTDDGPSTGSYCLEITGAGFGEIHHCRVDGPPESADTPVAAVYIHDFFGYLVVENCIFVASSDNTHALFLDNVSGSVIFRNCRFTVSSSVDDGWGILAQNGCENVIFENCQVIADNGQGVKVLNSGVTLDGLTVEGGSTAGVTDPQLLCGYGKTDLRYPFVVRNCRAIIGSANVDSSGTPAKAPIELGGADSTIATNGLTIVDGLYITYSSGTSSTHAYTTVILHGFNGSSTSVNHYDNITLNASSKAPGSGIVTGIGGSLNGGLLEVNGVADKPKTQMTNLMILGVREPAANQARGLFHLNNVSLRGFLIEGDGVVTAGAFTNALGIFSNSDVIEFHAFLQSAIKNGAGLGAFRALTKTTIRSARVRTHGLSFVTVFNLGDHSELIDSTIHAEAMCADSEIKASSMCSVVGCTVYREAEDDDVPLINLSSSGNTIKGNKFIWDVDAAEDIADLAGVSLAIGNIFASTASTAPTVSYPTGDGIGGDTLNMRTTLSVPSIGSL